MDKAESLILPHSQGIPEVSFLSFPQWPLLLFLQAGHNFYLSSLSFKVSKTCCLFLLSLSACMSKTGYSICPQNFNTSLESHPHINGDIPFCSFIIWSTVSSSKYYFKSHFHCFECATHFLCSCWSSFHLLTNKIKDVLTHNTCSGRQSWIEQPGVFCSLWTPTLCFPSYTLLFSFVIPHWDYLPGHNCRGTLLTCPKFLPSSLTCCWDSSTAARLLACCSHYVPSWPLTISLCSTCVCPISCLSPATSCINPTWQWQPSCSACVSRSTQQKHPGQESQVCDTAIINDILNVTGTQLAETQPTPWPVVELTRFLW